MLLKTLTLMGGLLLVFPILQKLNSTPDLNSEINSETNPPKENLYLKNLKKVHDFGEVFDDPSQGSIPYESTSMVIYKNTL